MSGDHVVPNQDWYFRISKERKLPLRCPFASVERCPRYYQSLSLLGVAGSTKIDPAEDERLLQLWRKSDLWPRTSEYETSIAGSKNEFGDWKTHTFSNFCPEVAYDRFGLFASAFGDYADDIDKDIAHERLGKEGVPGSDWRWRWAFVKPLHFEECSLYSPLLHSGPFPKGSEGTGLEIALGVPGASVRINFSWRELHRWLARQWARLRSVVWRR